MHLHAKLPIFVPEAFVCEIEKMSKAALMDLVWDFAVTSGHHQSDNDTMETLRKRRDIILTHRKAS